MTGFEVTFLIVSTPISSKDAIINASDELLFFIYLTKLEILVVSK